RQTTGTLAGRRQPPAGGIGRGPGAVMKSRLEFDLRLPLFAFTNSPEVVVAVSRAGGMGVLGAVPYTADELARHLGWIHANIQGRPYGVDIVMPASYAGADQGALAKEAFAEMIPGDDKKFIHELI